ncbi:hypothetical protein BsWGS_19153 [Bradybaena similaris]
MSWIQATSLCAFTCFLGFIGRSGGLNCSQCNVRFMGVHNLCNKPRNATGCIGCMKTVAKVKCPKLSAVSASLLETSTSNPQDATSNRAMAATQNDAIATRTTATPEPHRWRGSLPSPRSAS